MPDQKTTPIAPDESINSGFTAIPHDIEGPATTQNDFQAMNEADAKELGYTDERGQAVEKARPDVKGEPTGAYTDIGEGHSSVVHKKSTQH